VSAKYSSFMMSTGHLDDTFARLSLFGFALLGAIAFSSMTLGVQFPYMTKIALDPAVLFQPFLSRGMHLGHDRGVVFFGWSRIVGHSQVPCRNSARLFPTRLGLFGELGDRTAGRLQAFGRLVKISPQIAPRVSE
jgi:hypothetical protein